MLEDHAVVFRIVEAVHEVAGIAVKVVARDDDVSAVLHQQVVLKTLPKGVASDRDAAGVANLHVDLHVTEHVGTDRHIALARVLAPCAAQQ